jgi:hypothetical protein
MLPAGRMVGHVTLIFVSSEPGQAVTPGKPLPELGGFSGYPQFRHGRSLVVAPVPE